MAKPSDMPWVMAYFTVQDASKSLAFYEKAFGFTKRDVEIRAGDQRVHAEVQWHDAIIMFGPEGAYGGQAVSPATGKFIPSVSLYVYCDNCDALYAQATSAGAIGLSPPEDVFWGDRMCRVQDLDGHIWAFAHHTGKMSEPPTM